MISGISIASMCVTLIVTFILPIILFAGYGIVQKKKEVWIAGALGAAGFVLMQLTIRMPLLNVVALIPSFMEWVEKHYIWYCLILAFTAGLFELVGRYAVAKILYISKGITKELTYETGIAAGIGHGGIEAVAIVGATYINNLIFTILINSGAWEIMLDEIEASVASSGDMSMYQVYAAIPQQLMDTPWYLYLVAGYERILTMIAHIAMTMIVFYFVWKKKDLVGIIICLVCHTTLDFVSAVLSGLATDYLGSRLTQNTAYIYIYVFLTLVAVGAIIYLVSIRKKWECKEEKIASCDMSL